MGTVTPFRIDRQPLVKGVAGRGLHVASAVLLAVFLLAAAGCQAPDKPVPGDALADLQPDPDGGRTAGAPRPTAVMSGRVIGISDGDTIEVLTSAGSRRIRLHGIDCPERRQPFGDRARQKTAELCFGQTVSFRIENRDPFGRLVADVTLPDGRVLNEELVRLGLAWWFRRYRKDPRLEELERRAREAGIGLWRDPQPIAPWLWRQAHPRPDPPGRDSSTQSDNHPSNAE